MHHEPTEKELVEMWHDRPRLERLAALRDDTVPEGPEYINLQDYDFRLWRCKTRAELGSLAANIDALMICEELCLLLPDWLHQALPKLLISLAFPESSPGYKQARSRFKAETRKLKMQKRAKTVHSLYIKKAWPDDMAQSKDLDHVQRQQLEEIASWLGRQPEPQEVEHAIQRGTIPKNFEISSIVQASEIAHIALRGTWAQATAETIRQDYNSARVQLKTDLGKEVLSDREEEFVFWDVAFVHPETLQLLEGHQSQ